MLKNNWIVEPWQKFGKHFTLALECCIKIYIGNIKRTKVEVARRKLYTFKTFVINDVFGEFEQNYETFTHIFYGLKYYPILRPSSPLYTGTNIKNVQ